MMEQLVETSPLTGEQIAVYELPSDEAVDEAVARGREAWATTWGRTGIDERLALLRRLEGIVVEDMDRIVDVVGRTTGKIPLETLGAEVMTCLDVLRYHREQAARILAPEPRRSSLIFGRSRFRVERSPLGVVAVIAPWNYPLQLALVPVVTALAAGSCVVLKPSEVTPSVGALIGELCAGAGFPPGVVQVIQGGPRVGRALVAARPDLVFFTGSVATGKKVLAAAAEHLTPVVLELGGKDPMVVFADAHFRRAVAGAVYGAFTNAGQTCVAVERVYVEAPIYERFVEAVTVETRRLAVGPGGDVGPVINPAQVRVIDDHVDDALARGASLTTERRRDGMLVHPLVLRDTNHAMKVMTEETFGPVMPIMPFRSQAEAVALANDSVFGLNASVWTSDLDRGAAVASSIVCGSCAVNDVLKNIANPHMPFGGEKQSGLGRYHGPEGLLAFCRTKSVMISSGRAKKEINWFPYTQRGYSSLRALLRLLYGEAPVTRRMLRLATDLARGRGR